MTLWQDITATALLGTERQPIPTFASGNALGDLLAQITASENPDREAALLGAAAAISLHQQAGQVPIVDNQPPPDPCPPEERPRCSPRAAGQLSTMLSGDYQDVFHEWLSALDAAGQRIPEESLPDFLGMAQRFFALLQVVVNVIGERGQWLIRHNPMPTWNYALTGDVEAIWQTGNVAARSTLLERLHATEPDRARDLLASTWTEDRAEDRVAFLSAMLPSLTPDDEAFLEQALDDRSKQVRFQAADMLTRIPGSALSARMEMRAKHLLKLKTGKKSGIRVTLPDTRDATMVRDGVEEKPPSGMGAKAWWLTQILAAVPPSVWCNEWNKTPEEILKLLEGSDSKTALLRGLSLATVRIRDTQWAEMFLRANLKTEDIDIQALVGILPPDRREATVFYLMGYDSDPLHSKHRAFPILEHCTHLWSTELTIMVLDSIQQRFNVGVLNDYYMAPGVHQFSLHMSPSVVEEAEAALAPYIEKIPAWDKTISKVLNNLRFRHDMLKEFAQ